MAQAPRSRSALLAVAVALLLVTAGCSAIGATSTTDSPDEPRTEPGEFPPPPESLTASTAARTAAQYHLALLAERVEPVQPDGAAPIPGLDAVATETVARHGGGYYVLVQLTAAESAQDLAPVFDRAVYLVRANETPQPAMPIEVEEADGDQGGTGAAAALHVTNFASERANLSIVATRLDGSPETAMIETRSVRADEGLVVTDALHEPATYRVTAATGNATDSHRIRLDGAAMDSIGVFVSPDGAVEIYQIPQGVSGGG